MAINEEQVGGQVTLTATGPQHVYGIVTALPTGLQVEAKPPRSSKWVRTIYGWNDVLAYREGEDDGWAVVKTTCDVLDGVYVHDHTLIQLEDNGWYYVPQYDENAEDEVGVVFVSSQAEVQIITDAFNKLADGTPTMKPSSRGRGRKKADEDEGESASAASVNLPDGPEDEGEAQGSMADESQQEEGPIAPKRRKTAAKISEDGIDGKKKKKKKKKKKEDIDDGWNE